MKEYAIGRKKIITAWKNGVNILSQLHARFGITVKVSPLFWHACKFWPELSKIPTVCAKLSRVYYLKFSRLNEEIT